MIWTRLGSESEFLKVCINDGGYKSGTKAVPQLAILNIDGNLCPVKRWQHFSWSKKSLHSFQGCERRSVTRNEKESVGNVISFM